MGYYAIDTFSNLTSYKLARDIETISVPICATFGILGNLLSFIVLVSSSLLKSTTCMYMLAIAVFDTIVLINAVLTLMDLKNREVVVCNLLSFLFYFSIHSGALLIVAMTFERYIVVKYPLKAAGWVTKTRTKRIILTVGVLSFLINIPQGTMRKIQFIAEKGEMGCFYEGESNVFFFTKIYPWIDAIVYCFIPVSSLFILNILIIKNLKNSKLNLNDCTNRQSAINKQQKQITIMLILVSVAFLVLTGPIGAMLVIQRYLWIPKTPGDLADYRLIHAVIDNMMLSNHALNFIIYVVSGQKFRQQLKKIVCRRHFKNGIVRRERQVYVSQLDGMHCERGSISNL
ncbi:hypothetical protein SNE40_012339 [Patella caerulea]|uniref:G-protein coupled receptors family 1 profile domain-containing protein n=1 Tax=Patella caerulea TaxID=87958 RepID=A0AAN8PN47_PATCE